MKAYHVIADFGKSGVRKYAVERQPGTHSWITNKQKATRYSKLHADAVATGAAYCGISAFTVELDTDHAI